MSDPVQYKNVTIEDVDRAIRDWFDRTVDARVEAPEGLKKVPVIFSSGERWSVGRTKQAFRDSNGVLILPVISVRRVDLVKNAQQSALGVQTRNIQIARRVDPKTNDVRNLGQRGTVYDVYTIPFPDAMIATYQVVVQAQYITQMNDFLQKMFRSLDIQRQFVAPLGVDRPQTPRTTQVEGTDPIGFPYVVGFMESAASDASNFEEFTDQERIIKYQTELTVPFVMMTSPEGQEPAVKVERTAYKFVLRDEDVHWVDDPAELDKIFGPNR